MHLIRGVYSLPEKNSGCVATIGNFDGVHLGHRAIIKQVSEQGAKLGLPSLVMVFEPQPMEFFQGELAPPRIMTLAEKLAALEECGVDTTLCLRFNQQFRSLSAQEFIQKILVDGIGVKYLVVGDDFHFGNDRAGDFWLLQQAGRQHGFEVVHTNTFELDQRRVSSTWIREALASGDLDTVSQLMGRPFSITGHVNYGQQLGRTINVPTANVYSGKRLLPLKGVYAAEVHGVEQHPLPAVCNVGNRPTVDGGAARAETHILNFNGNLYGRKIKVEFKKFIRPEKKFSGIDELKQAIQADIEAAKSFFQLD